MGQTNGFELAQAAVTDGRPALTHDSPIAVETAQALSDPPKGYEKKPGLDRPKTAPEPGAGTPWEGVPKELLDQWDSLVYDHPAPWKGPAQADVNQAPKAKEEAALKYIDGLTDEIRQNLPPEKQAAIKEIERAIAYGDVSKLSDCLHKMAANPKASQDVMYTVVRDLAAVNIGATWNYSSDQGETGQPPAAVSAGLKDIGQFTIAIHDGAKAIGIIFYTEGEPKAVGTSLSGDPQGADPAKILDRIRGEWLKRMCCW